MRTFRNILLVAGGEGWENAALKRAVTLAKHCNAQLEVVDVIEGWPHKMRMLATRINLDELQKSVLRDRRAQLEQVIGPFRETGLRITAEILVGTPFLEIIREVLRKKHHLVIKTARGAGRFKKSLFGSTAMHLMRKCPCPVWVIKPSQTGKFSKVMAAIDVDMGCEESRYLNVRILKLASSLTQLEESELHVIHVWKLYGETMLSAHGTLNRHEVDLISRETRNNHKDWLTELTNTYAAGTPLERIHLVKGDAERIIPSVAKKKGIKLIVMGTVCRTGIEGFFIGNTAEKVLQQVDCSVLTVKPLGFMSPVKLV